MNTNELPEKSAPLDLGRLTPWFQESVAEIQGSLSCLLIPGGRSNLTYEIRDRHRVWILRRPPMGPLLASAHDMGRECQVIRALGATEFPVPRVYSLCTDVSVLGAPFYVMDKVEGSVYRTADDLAQLGPDGVREVAESLVDILAALHGIDPTEVGLADFGRPKNFSGRQVDLWRRQLEGARTRELPDAETLYSWLIDHVPHTSAASIVHGDYRVDNVIFQGVMPAAVIDWEMATVGDPITDLALLTAYQRVPMLRDGPAVFDATMAPGHPDVNEILERYARATRQSLDHFPFYAALAFYKLAAIHEGIVFRGRVADANDPNLTAIHRLVPRLLSAGLAAAQG